MLPGYFILSVKIFVHSLMQAITKIKNLSSDAISRTWCSG